jgi:predicted nucleotidyltransferase
MNIDKNKTRKIIDLCKQHRVKELSLFGSILTDDFHAESDIDLLVEFKEIDVLDYFDNFMDFKEKLEILLGRKIDLVENQAIRNPIFRRSIDRNKQLIYG